MAALGIQIAWQGRKSYERRMRTARKRLSAEIKKTTRKAAKVIMVATRKSIRKEFGGRGKDRRRPGGRKPGGLARKTSVSVRSRRGNVRAEIGPKYPHGAYGALHEKGGVSDKRRAHTRGGSSRNTRALRHKVRAHSTNYAKRPWLAPAVASTSTQVYQIIGRSFRVV